MRISSTSPHHPLHRQRRKLSIPLGAQRFLAAFEGFEGGFAIGTSIVVALSFIGMNRDLLLYTAIVSIVVNGFNSASMKYTSEHYMDELDGREKENEYKYYFLPALVEFIAYFAISFFAIVPLIFLTNISHALWLTIAITLLILFLAGYLRGYMLRTSRWRDAVEATVLGAGIILVGVISGYILHTM
mgnify:CR=1 FL=1